MPYGTLAEREADHSPEAIATELRRLADELEEGEQLTATSGDEATSAVDLPPDDITFSLDLERQPTDGGDEVRLALALEWEEDAEMELGL